MFFLILLFGLISPAQFDLSSFLSNSNSDYEKEIRLKVKNRTYPGGKDEDPLRIQTQLNFSLRKMQPAQEATQTEDRQDAQENQETD